MRTHTEIIGSRDVTSEHFIDANLPILKLDKYCAKSIYADVIDMLSKYKIDHVPVHFSVDIDVFDPRDVTDAGFPLGPAPSYEVVIDSIVSLYSLIKDKVTSIDIVETYSSIERQSDSVLAASDVVTRISEIE